MVRPNAGTVASGLGPVAARGHVAPASATGPRRVVERPSAPIVGADAEAIGVAAGGFARDALRDAPESVVERVSLVAMVESDASPLVGRPDREDESLTGRHRPIHDLDGAPRRWAPLSGGIDDLAKRGPDGSDLTKGAIGCRAGRLEPLERGFARVVDDAAAAQPLDPVGRRAEVIDRNAVLELERVEEFEGVVNGQMMIVGIHWSRFHVTNI